MKSVLRAALLSAVLVLPASAREFTVVTHNVENLFDADGKAVFDDDKETGGATTKRPPPPPTVSRSTTSGTNSPPEKRYSDSHDGKWGTLMQMMITPGLYDHSGLQYVDGSFAVVVLDDVNTVGVLDLPRRWTSFGEGAGTSDHFPIAARIRRSTSASCSACAARSPRCVRWLSRPAATNTCSTPTTRISGSSCALIPRKDALNSSGNSRHIAANGNSSWGMRTGSSKNRSRRRIDV